jgi:hypothetical protein
MPAFGATRLQNLAPVLGFHPLPEAVHAQTAALFGLPGTLDHDSVNPPKTANRDSAALKQRNTSEAGELFADQKGSIAYGQTPVKVHLAWVRAGGAPRHVGLVVSSSQLTLSE